MLRKGGHGQDDRLPQTYLCYANVAYNIPPSYFASILCMISKFLWQSAPARISLAQLFKPKHLGGIGLPDLRAYYLACQATRIVEWHLHSDTKDWKVLEHVFTPDPLHFLP